MTANVIIALDTRRKKNDGTYPVILRLSFNRRTLSIPTTYSIPEKDWDDNKRQVKPSYKGVSSIARLNNELNAQRTAASDIILKLQESGQLDDLSLVDLKSRIIRQSNSLSFFDYAHDLIAELIEARRIGTARSYECIVSVLKDYINGKDPNADNGKPKNNDRDNYKGKDLKFSDVNYRFLTKFETYHYQRGNGANGLAVYMRTIRAIYNKAIKAGLVEADSYPFKNYRIETEPTAKRALDWGLLKEIISLQLEPTHECFYARNYFVASYLMYGMNFADMAYLQKSDIANSRIRYRRRKTGKLYDIKITPALQEILNYYMTLPTNSPYVFPILKREAAEQQDNDIRWARKRYNRKLKELATLCGVPDNLTTYVSRHSFATQAMLQDVPVTAISSMLGHSSIKTTEIYLKSLPTTTLDDYNARILQ